MRTIYLDYNATTPLDARVRKAMQPAFEEAWGNPSSVHHVGQSARTLLDEARERVAATLKCKPSELIFTSGGSESTNLALLGMARHLRSHGRHIITSAVEHDAVLHPCEYLANNDGFEVTFLPVDGVGRVSPVAVREAIRPDTVLVSIMAATTNWAPSSRWPRLVHFVPKMASFSTPTPSSGSANFPLLAWPIFRRIWFPYAAINSTVPKVRGYCTPNRRSIWIPFCTVAHTKMNAAREPKISPPFWV